MIPYIEHLKNKSAPENLMLGWSYKAMLDHQKIDKYA